MTTTLPLRPSGIATRDCHNPFESSPMRSMPFRSVRIGMHYRALAVDIPDGLLWFWIGSHADYDRVIE